MFKIAIDFDETLFPTLEKVLEVYNKRHETKLELSNITTYNLSDSFETDVADELINLFVEREIYSALQPYKGAVKSVKMLIEQGHEVYVATSTDVRNMEWKEDLLQRHFPFIPKKNLIRIYNKALLNADVMIEDKIENLTQTFADRICFNQPWNQSEEKDYVYDIHRVNNWSEVVDIIKEIERKNKEWEK
jgi:5'(3')-deoxyribonucleotidase